MPSLSEFRIYFSATTQTVNRLVNIIWAFVAAFERPIVITSPSRCPHLAPGVQVAVHTGRLLFTVTRSGIRRLHEMQRMNRRVASFTGRLLFTVTRSGIRRLHEMQGLTVPCEANTQPIVWKLHVLLMPRTNTKLWSGANCSPTT
jgi:hypothetical protein